MFRVFGIDKPSIGLVWRGLGILFLFGLSVNGAYDIYKALLTGILGGGWSWCGTVLAGAFPGMALLFIIYKYIEPFLKRRNALAIKQSTTPEKVGLIVPLSVPMEKPGVPFDPQELSARIDTTNIADELFSIQGMGQIFRGICAHKDTLKYIWLITTQKSRDYEGCLKTFLGKFVRQAKVCSLDYSPAALQLDTSSEMRTMESAKNAVAAVLDRENMDRLDLSKDNVVVDITPGTKMMSLGMAFGALQTGVDFQYVEQKDFSIVSMKVPVEIVLDRVADYLREIYDAKYPKEEGQQKEQAG